MLLLIHLVLFLFYSFCLLLICSLFLFISFVLFLSVFISFFFIPVFLLRTPPPPRQRERRVLPTPPQQQPDSLVARPQRNRQPPQYLSDYVTSKQATTQPEWMMKVNWLKQDAKDGTFKGLEMELARTIMEIMKETA
jgi:hypothetical protein